MYCTRQANSDSTRGSHYRKIIDAILIYIANQMQYRGLGFSPAWSHVQLPREDNNRRVEIVRSLIFIKFSIRFPCPSNVTVGSPIQYSARHILLVHLRTANVLVSSNFSDSLQANSVVLCFVATLLLHFIDLV